MPELGFAQCSIFGEAERFTSGDQIFQIWKYRGCRKTNKGETLIKMGCEVDLPPGCIFYGAWIRTMQYLWRGGTFYIGGPKMSKIQKMGM